MILICVQWYLIAISMKNNIKHLSICLFVTLVKCLIKSFALIFIVFFLLYCENVYSGYKSFITFMFSKYLPPVCYLSVYFFRGVFQRSEALNFEQVQFISCFMVYIFVSSLKLYKTKAMENFPLFFLDTS